MKPGAIMADVIADQAGSDYNIGPSSFTIPGFEGGDKFSKFYAKSSEAFVGGKMGNDVSATVSQQDIDTAKAKAEQAFKDKITQETKADLSEGEIILKDAQKIVISSSKTSAKPGDNGKSFEYSVSGKENALVFNERDVRKIIEDSLSNSDNQKNNIQKIVQIEYGSATMDFDKLVLDVKSHVEVLQVPVIDAQQIKQDFLGKSQDQLAGILKKYPDVHGVKIDFSPTFISRIPQNAQRVSVEVETP
jgi:hypothetical protein